jgi:hypothetical protein
LRDEEYDFLSLRDRLERDPVLAFLDVLRSSEFRTALGDLPGFETAENTGETVLPEVSTDGLRAPDTRTGEPVLPDVAANERALE